MAAVFWARKGVLMVEFMQQGTTVMSQVYCETLKKLPRTIQNKKHGMLTSGVVLLDDNERPHTAARTRALLEHVNWELFDHPPYSPDLAPSEYHLLSYLKTWLGSQQFNNNEESLKGVKCGGAYRRQTSLTQAYKNLFPDTTSASVLVMTMLRNSLSMYFLYIIIFFSYCLFC
jgi:histone-lysine N-methyltransferase SETMAR